MSVVLHHLGFAWIPGGFLGVDIFFVISGYLITAILLRTTGQDKKRYFREFYFRRLRRIFPALFTTIFSTLVAGYFLLLPEDYIELAQSGAAAVGFVSNIYFSFNTGYFDAPAGTMPLLHTWSLGVEEQFYLVWPLLVLALVGLRAPARIVACAVLFTTSLLLSLFLTPVWPSLAFYNFPFRIFQFMLGAAIPVVAIANPGRIRISVGMSLASQMAGLALIAYAFLYINTDDYLPGWLALIPSIGAGFIIVSTFNPGNPASILLNNRLSVGVGKISYSLYLWHWPIITFYKIYVGTSELNLLESGVLLLCCMVISIGSYRCIETPFRNPRWRIQALRFSSATALLSIAVSGIIVSTSGVISRIPDADKFTSRKVMWAWDCPRMVKIDSLGSFCNFGVPFSTASAKVLLWGDSHARQLIPLLQYVAERHQLSFLVFPSCGPLTDGSSVLVRHAENPKRATKGCYKAIQQALSLIGREKDFKLAAIVSCWRCSEWRMYSPDNGNPGLEERLGLLQIGLDATVSSTTALGLDVLLLGDTPLQEKYSPECVGEIALLRSSELECLPLSRQYVDEVQGATEKRVQSVAAANDQVFFHSIIESHCSDTECPLFSQGEYIYRDRGHIRRNLTGDQVEELANSFGLLNAIDWSKYSATK